MSRRRIPQRRADSPACRRAASVPASIRRLARRRDSLKRGDFPIRRLRLNQRERLLRVDVSPVDLPNRRLRVEAPRLNRNASAAYDEPVPLDEILNLAWV